MWEQLHKLNVNNSGNVINFGRYSRAAMALKIPFYCKKAAVLWHTWLYGNYKNTFTTIKTTYKHTEPTRRPRIFC